MTSRVGVLLVHGLTGTPETMEPVATALRKLGYIVEAPILFGHGSSIKKLSTSPWESWYADVMRSYANLKQRTDKIFCAGISLGSLLSLLLSTKVHVDGLVVISTPLKLRSWVVPLAKLIDHPPFKWIYPSAGKDLAKSVFDPEGRELYKKASYSRIPVHSVLETEKVRRLVLKRLPLVTTPLLIIHSEKDGVALPAGVPKLKRGVRSPIVKEEILTKSGHVVTFDFERDRVIASIIDFIKSLS